MEADRTRRSFCTAAATAGTALLAGCTASASTRSEREPLEREYAVDDVDALAVDGVVGDVTIRGTDREGVLVEGEKAAESEDGLDDVELQSERDGDRLELTVENDQSGLLSSLLGQAPRLDLTVSVPRSLSVERATTSTGDLTVTDVAGDLTAEVSTGDAEVRDVDGAVTATGSTANVTVTDVAGPIEADVSTGDLTVEGTVARLEASTGSIDATVTDLVSPATVEASTGDVDLTLASDLDVGVDAEASTGDVVVDGDFDRVERDGDDEATAVLGEGEQTLRASVSTGDVRLSTT